MQINYSLVLPRDALTVPMVRRLSRSAMLEFGVAVSEINDVSLAVTEACSNVIEHSSADEDEYEIRVAISERQCDVRIIDQGHGLTESDLMDARAQGLEGERGRGIQIMEALMDIAQFESRREEGTVVHLVKRLTLEDDSLIRRVMDGDGDYGEGGGEGGEDTAGGAVADRNVARSSGSDEAAATS